MDGYLTNNSTSQDVYAPKADEYLIEMQDQLSLKGEDDVLIQIANKKIEDDKSFYSRIFLKDRQDRNFKWLFARKSDNFSDLYKKTQYNDNILYEIESTLKPLATSKDPDILVYPGQDNDQSRDTAEQLTKGLQVAINTRDLKEIKALAFKHLPVYFIGAVKYFWNPEKGEHGDYEFCVVHPQNLVIDHNAKSTDIRKMDHIAESKEVTIQELIMRFPDKEEELLQKLVSQRKLPDQAQEYSQKQLSTRLKIWEIWFKFYEQKGKEFSPVSSVMWYYEDIVFKKIRNPNWDWAGKKKYFKYDEEIKPQELYDSFMGGQTIEGFRTEDVYYNYFDEPQFPYIFIGYDKWGTMVYDETSRIEQLVRLQEILDNRGDQIRRMLNRAMGKHFFSTEANLKAEDIEDLNLEDIDQAVIVDGDANKTHKFVASEQPSPQMVNDYNAIRQISFQKSHVNAITGALQSSTATSNQIAREANFTYADDLVDSTINFMSEEMARAIMQMIKLRYTEEHFVRMLGAQGKMTFQRLHRDMIEDGMEVTITASATDKLQAQNRAMDMAKLQLTDPLSFYEDIGVKNPDERAKRLMMFLNDPMTYMSEYINGTGGTTEEMAQSLNGTTGGGQQATMDIAMMIEGQMPEIPQQVDPEYAQTILTFLESPDFMSLPPELQQQILDYAAQIAAMAQEGAMSMEQQSMQAPQRFGQAGGAGGPNTNPGNPTPTNTENIAFNPPTSPPAGSPRNL